MPTLVKNARRDRVLVAFDPGISGAAAFHTVETGHLMTAEDLPVVAGQVDAVSLANRLSEMKPVVAFIERIGSCAPGSLGRFPRQEHVRPRFMCRPTISAITYEHIKRSDL
jgi:hypothetical protein